MSSFLKRKKEKVKPEKCYWEFLGDHIWILKKNEKDEFGIRDYKKGYYFADETGNFNGPFKKRSRAEAAQKQYAELI